MENQNTTNADYETRLKEVVSLAGQGKFSEAKTLADKLVEEGLPRTRITCACHPVMRHLISYDIEEAVKLANLFKEYDFRAWITESWR
jgi:hypothetical protein